MMLKNRMDLIKRSFLFRFYRAYLKMSGCYGKIVLNEFVNSHFPKHGIKDKKRICGLIKKDYAFRGFPYEEFWQFRFDLLSKTQKNTMIPVYRINRFYDVVNSEQGRSHMLFDKWKTYLLYKDLYGRDACLIRKNKEKDGEKYNVADLDIFRDFVANHSEFIIKPLFLDSGLGVKKIEVKGMDFATVLSECPDDDFMAEELIVESESLAKYNPSSVNTLRINTVYFDDNDIEIFRPIMRFGNGNVVVDNAHFGGLFAVVDPKTGLMTHAGDLDRHDYVNHPYTKLPIVGQTIPNWEEACEISRMAARRLPDHVFTGWDLALTDSGWVIIEGNAKPGLLDSALTGIGPRDELKRIREKIRK